MFKLVTIWLVVVTCCLALHDKPTLRSRISRRGLDFFSSIGHNIVTKELPKIKYPNISLPIDGGPGSGQVNLTRLYIPKFESPKFKFELAPPHGITWHSRDGAVKVYGEWSAKYTMLVTIYLSGYVTATVSDIRSTLTVGVHLDNEKPQLSIWNCTAQVEHFQMEIGGGVIPWIVNLFRGPLSEAVLNAINTQFCDTTRTVLLQQANEALMSLPTRIPITDEINLDYRLLKNPISTSSYVEGETYIDVIFGNKTCDLPAGDLTYGNVSTDFMLNMWMSDSVANCLLQSLHETNLLHFVIDRGLYSKLDSFLKTSCPFYEICLGRFFPELSKKYPNNYVDLYFHSSKPPATKFSSNITANAEFFIDFHISPYKKNPHVLARLSMFSNSTITPALSKSRIVGTLNETDLRLSEEFSEIGNFSQTFLNRMALILKPLLKVTADTALRVGIPIPMVENITLASRTSITVLERTLRIDADLLYANKTLTTRKLVKSQPRNFV
uniref:Lipopolysaccharide-binding protein n=1 Tax=Acrobeloides nanus TaxID=290746 RepID=A0A914CI60_9BILA